ncbi:MAG: CsgG/HfaB family protein [Elusimicrobiota bacterium]
MNRNTLIICLSIVVLCFNNAYSENQKLNIAVADFNARNVSELDSAAISDLVRTELVRLDSYNVVDRGNMEKILAEQKFQLQNCTDQECIIKMGRLLNVEKIVTGYVIKIEGVYQISISFVNVETGKIEQSERMRCINTRDFAKLTENLVLKLTRKDEVSQSNISTGLQITEIIDKEKIIVNKGKFDNMRVGGIYLVINNKSQKKGYIRIIETGNITSTALIIDERESKISAEDFLKYSYFYYRWGLGFKISFPSQAMICLNYRDDIRLGFELSLGENGTDFYTSIEGSGQMRVNCIKYMIPIVIRYYSFINDFLTAYTGGGLSLGRYGYGNETIYKIKPVFCMGLEWLLYSQLSACIDYKQYVGMETFMDHSTDIGSFNIGVSYHFISKI